MKNWLTRGIWCWLLVWTTLPGQSRVGEWDSFTSFLDTRRAVEIDRKIVCATSGGILVFDSATESFETLTNVDGLEETDLFALELDRNGHLWVGSSSPRGVVQIYDVEKKQTVKTFNFDLSSVADIAASDSAVFVSYSKNLEWGILEFIWSEGEFIYRQTYDPSEESLEYISDLAIRGDSLFAATDKGLFVGNYRDLILNYPQNWEILSEFPLSPVTRLRKNGEELLIVANGEIWSFTDTLEQLSDRFSGETTLLDVARSEDATLYGLQRWRVVRFTENGTIDGSWWRTKAEGHRLEPLSDGNLLVSSDRGIGIWSVDEEAFDWHVPNTPVSNVYTALAVQEDGSLVAAGKEGVSVLTEYGWHNLVPSRTRWAVRDHDPEEYSRFVADTVQYKSSRVWSLLEDGDRIFMSIQGVIPDTNEFGDPIGGGVVEINLADPRQIAVHDSTDEHIDPFNDKGYMNVRGLLHDGIGNLWISNFGAADPDKKITVLTPEGGWFHIPQLGSGGIPQKLENPTDVAVSESGIVLIGSSKDDGFFVLKLDQDSDEDGLPDALDEDADDDGVPNDMDDDDDGDGIPDGSDSIPVSWVSFSTKDGLSNNTVWSVVSQEPHVAWSLSAQGLQRLTFNSDYSGVTPYFFTYFSGVPFGEGSKVVMDGRNNVWVSSVTAGVYVLLANSTPWPDWTGFRHRDSYLLSDEVTAIAFDNMNGIAYIATSKGINSLRIPFAREKRTFDDVTIFPSPFRIPSTRPMVIDGLMDNSSLKIMMLSGRVLLEIPSTSPSLHGYQAFWDGRSGDGVYVGTGVYLVAIYSETGQTHVAKIAVIRD
ncbi:MAG: hypothetical protein V3U24_09275 [Candidatus Neomarinimicrobiota bacterium]